MKKSRLQRHTRINPGTKGLKRTGFKSKPQDLNGTPRGSGLARSCGSVGDASPDGPTTQPNGPVKKRLESSTIPPAIRDAVLERDGHACVRCGAAVQRPYYSLHHRRARGMGGSRRLHSMANLVTLCGSGTTGCHGDVESDRDASEAVGWLLPRRLHTITPEEWPVLRWTPNGQQWMQPGDGWSVAVPHERQLELLEEVA